jgi:hypothetical protein
MHALTDLAERLLGAGSDASAGRDPTPNWAQIHDRFQAWAAQPGLRRTLRGHLQDLPTDAVAAVTSRSRETTTHFSWCLRDRPDEPFSFWLHEYKPQYDRRPGYADSVHNHRYHFCSALLRGEYLHELHDVTLDPVSDLIAAVALLDSNTCVTGDSGFLLASDFHRIPRSADGTMTFVVKSGQVNPWSLSFDPATGTGHRHVPVETRLADLANGM